MESDKMESDKCVSRINTLEIKSLIYRRVGHQRAENYFHHLGGFLSMKISKTEFDKFCIKTIGRENIPLHNRLVRSLLKNASAAKSPPPKRPGKLERSIKPLNGYHKNPLQSLYGDKNGQHFPQNGRLCKLRDRPSPLGPLGKPQSFTTNGESVSRAQSASELFSLGSRPPVEVVSVEEGEEVEQAAGSPSIQSKGPITAPFGVSFNYRARARKTVTSSNETCHYRLELPDSRTLMNLLGKKLEMEGVKVSMNSVDLLNNGLDAYLKRLIEPSLGLAGSHNQFGPTRRHIPLTERSSSVSLMDFRTAMELNPQILGEDWPSKLEKICSRAAANQDS